MVNKRLMGWPSQACSPSRALCGWGEMPIGAPNRAAREPVGCREIASTEMRRVASETATTSDRPSGANGYVPSADEEYMSERQIEYFRNSLEDWKKSILESAEGTLQSLQDGPIREPDPNDRASSETDWGIELRTRDRQRKLIAKIDSALRRIDEGEYGYCVVSGEPIGIGRLIARPIATMTVEAQEAHERREKISRDD